MNKSNGGKEDSEYFDCVFKSNLIQDLVVLSGDSGVGKSNILLRYYINYHRLIKNVFTKVTPTIGVEFAIQNFILKNNCRVKAQIWDTCNFVYIIAGCERYRAITTGHYRRAEGALLVYDITCKDSFKSLGYWLKELKDHADPNIKIALVANKVDIMFTDPGKREVPKNDAIEFAKKNGLIFNEESSALADVNIKNVIEKLVSGMLIS